MCPAENHPPCQALGVMDAMERITRAISGGDAGNGQVGAVLDVMLDVFDADRAWLLAEREGEPEVWDALAERTRSAWPGVLAAAAELRADAFHRDLIAAARRTGRPVAALRPDRQSPVAEQFTIRSELMTVVSPHGRPALLVGLHHCRRACRYDDVEGLFFVVASRLADALATQWALAARRQSEERFRILVEHAPEAIVILDATSGLFVDANEGASRLFGVARDELIDRAGPADFSPVQQPDGRPSPAAAMEWIGRAVAGEAPTFEWTHRSRQGQDIPCEISLVRLPDSERTLVRGTMVDITQRKRAEREKARLEAQLVQAQKLEAVGQLTGGVAHDFNNLLTVIVGNVELAQQFPGDTDLVTESLQQVAAAAERASALTSRLLAFSRKQPLRPRSLDMGDVLRGMDDMLRRTLGEHIELEIVLAGGLWRCEADPSQLENAILNLCVNARDAMPEGGALTIDAGNASLDDDYARAQREVTPGQYVLVAVSDSGTGMSEAVQANIFEPFFTTKDVGKGSGLGLSMVYGFVKQSGGHVKVYSEPGEGTTVKLYLPRASADTPAPRAVRPDAGLPRGGGETILVVEDAADVRQLARQLLERLGYRVREADRAVAALEILAGDAAIDLLFTDVVLPGGLNGVELATEAQRLRPGLAVLYTSGYTANAIIHNGRLDRGVRLVQKPFTRDTLGRRVREALDEGAAGPG